MVGPFLEILSHTWSVDTQGMTCKHVIRLELYRDTDKLVKSELTLINYPDNLCLILVWNILPIEMLWVLIVSLWIHVYSRTFRFTHSSWKISKIILFLKLIFFFFKLELLLEPSPSFLMPNNWNGPPLKISQCEHTCLNFHQTL